MINQITTNNTAPAIEQPPKPPNATTMNDARLARIEWAHTRLMLYLVCFLVTINVLTLIGVAAILAILAHSLIMPLPPVGGP